MSSLGIDWACTGSVRIPARMTVAMMRQGQWLDFMIELIRDDKTKVENERRGRFDFSDRTVS
jgi:hypothetical protein